MDGPPPPPPPHGANPKTTGGSPGTGGLPAGNYDIFIIPPHSAGGGFIYLPSLQVQRNSFLAGVGSTLAAIAVWFMVEPTLKMWFMLATQSVSSGGNGVILLVLVVGAAGWGWGRSQSNGGFFGDGNGPGGPSGGAGAGAGAGANYQRAPPPPPHGSYPGNGAPPPQGASGGWGGSHQQRGGAAPQDGESWSGSQPDPEARAQWEQAQEEQRKKEEEEKKKKEEEQKKQDEERRKKQEADRQAKAKAEKEKWEKMRAREREQRERDARERLAKERAQKEKEAKEKAELERIAKEAEARAKIEREIREKLEAEQKAKAAEEALKKAAEEKAKAEAAAAKAKADAERAERLKAARERAQREREARLKNEAEKIKTEQLKAAAESNPTTGRRSTTYGGLGGGEKLDPYAGAKSPPPASVTSTHSSPIKATVTPKKNYERPSAQSYVGTEDEHSYRPYDTPKRPPKPPSHASSYTASSYAESASTARTTPPPSRRGPYSTTDPDKIQIKAVYLFNDLFPKPVAQLVANVGKVTDGLILKIQSEGLFIDDDVRCIPQREWDVKAWTLKLVETGQQPSKGLHIFRASVRDADGKKYVFFIDESESWKLAIGLQRLRKGSQVRSLQNTQMGPGEITRILNAVPPIAL